MLKLGFTNETKARVSKDFFGAVIKRFYKVMKTVVDKKLLGRNGLIDVVLIDDVAMQQMNLEYRKKDRVTDIISFAYLEVTDYKKEKGDVIAGDIFISVDTAKRQAEDKKHSLKDEMEFLFVHGLLHCFGFDHKTDKQEKEMDGWAEKVMGV